MVGPAAGENGSATGGFRVTRGDGGGLVVGDLVVGGGVGPVAEGAGHGDGFLLTLITWYQRPRIQTVSPGLMVAWECPGVAPVVICWSRMVSQ